MRSFGLAGVALLWALPALAQDIDCANTELQIEMNQCAEQDWQIADDDLNAAYADTRAAMREIDAGLPQDEQGAAANLLEAQKAWVIFRDANCTAEGYAWHGGSAEALVIYGCLARLTVSRTEDLQAMIAEQ